MRLIAGTSVLLYLACVVAFIIPLIRGGIKPQLAFHMDRNAWRTLAWALPLLLVWYAVGAFLHVDAVSGFPYFLASLLSYWLLGCFSFTQPGMRGALLLIGALALSNTIHDPTALPVPLVSALLGLSVGRFIAPNTSWADYLLPATWLTGITWIAVSSPDALQTPFAGLLAIVLSVALLLRAVQALPFISEHNTLVRATFVVITGGLAAWLLCQTLLLQPKFLPWVWLFTGGVLLAFLMPAVLASDSTDASSGLSGASQLVLIGIAALVASRLFGTLGWLVVAAGLLGNLKPSRSITLATLFFTGRSLLQVYLFQYNPNVTGINITHPYASAALYVGVAAMLLLPTAFNRLFPPNATDTDTTSPPENRAAWAILLFAALLAGALANYFLHAEATGSLLVAMLTAGLGVGLLGRFQSIYAGSYALLLPIITINGAALSQELLTTGNEAEKIQKLIVLGVLLLVSLVAVFLLWRASSGRKPIPVA